jgi:CubicO group peptidase (beta-lactamase class C family)
LETTVSELVPEFGTNGKDVVTIEQVMIQTGGFPSAPLDLTTAQSREARLQKFSKWRLNFEPGTASEYHPTSAHWVLAEVIERTSGMDYRTFIRTRIADPIGIPNLALGVSEDPDLDVADLVAVGESPSAEDLAHAEGDWGEVTIDHMLNFNNWDVRALGVPAAGALATAADFAMLYQEILLNSHEIWDAALLQDATSTVRNSMWDQLLGNPASLGLGVMIQGNDGVPRGMGSTVSPRTFGWGGAGGQVAWVDPDSGLSFSFLTNGIDRNPARWSERRESIATLAGSTILP